MRIRYIASLLGVLLFAGLMFSSCREDGPEKINPDITDEGTGYISLNVSIDGIVGGATKGWANDGESPGYPGESSFNDMLMILYGPNGDSYLIKKYNVSYLGGSFQGDERVTFDEDTKTLTLPPIEVKKQSYRMLVMFNFMNNFSTTSLGVGQKFFEPHNVSLLEEPIDFYTGFGEGSRVAVEKGINKLLSLAHTGMYPNESMDGIPDNVKENNNALMVMSNADGLRAISLSEIKNSEEEAKVNPILVNVDRALAKVGVFRGDNIDGNGILLSGGKVNNFKWACDNINMRTFLIRNIADVAPNTPPAEGAGLETPSTPRKYRYAVDPNPTGVSKKDGQNPGNKPELHFFRIPPEGTYSNVPYLNKPWNIGDPDINNDWYTFEYVTENTMEADEQWEDVTTRVVVQCNYVPYATTQSSPIGDNQSYYAFRDCFFTEEQMAELASYSSFPDEIDEKIDELIAENPNRAQLGLLKDVLKSSEVRTAYGWSGTVIHPDKSVSSNDLNYYKNGVNYYYILIRHFDDAKSGTLMGYGRYGVVRNNVYRIKVNDIKGPGYIAIPEPKGPDDKDPLVDAEILVRDWTSHDFNFDL